MKVRAANMEAKATILQGNAKKYGIDAMANG